MNVDGIQTISFTRGLAGDLEGIEDISLSISTISSECRYFLVASGPVSDYMLSQIGNHGPANRMVTSDRVCLCRGKLHITIGEQECMLTMLVLIFTSMNASVERTPLPPSPPGTIISQHYVIQYYVSSCHKFSGVPSIW